MKSLIKILALILICCSLMLYGCGGSSGNGSTTGDVRFSGNLAALPQTLSFTREVEGSSPVQNALITLGDGSGTTDESGNFSFGASFGSFDSSRLTLTVEIGGDLIPVSLPALPGSAWSVSINLLQETTGEVTAHKVKVGDIDFSVTGSIDPIGFRVDCFCDDGFGPVGEAFVCADTGSTPTNCVSVPIYDDENPCADARSLLCGCQDVDCQDDSSGDDDDDDSGCDEESKSAAQCIVDNEADVCAYFGDLAEDPDQTTAEGYANGYADACF